MAITLGDLRTFAQEMASPDSSGASADREFMVWINGALRRVYSELSWDKILHERKINIPIEETGTAMTVTQDSLALVLTSGTFLAKYVTDRWNLAIDGDATQVFELASIDDSPTNQNATMRDGDQWIEATATGKSYTFYQTIFSLPDNAERIERVQILASGLHVIGLEPDEFDHQRSFNIQQRGQYPRFFTFRAGNLEIWPHPGTTRVKLGISYTKGPTAYTTATADATTIEWEEKHRDLLEKAIMLEAAIYQGDQSPVPYGIAEREYMSRLNRYKSLNNQKRNRAGPMRLLLPRPQSNFPPKSFSWVGELEDV